MKQLSKLGLGIIILGSAAAAGAIAKAIEGANANEVVTALATGVFPEITIL